MRSVNGRHFKLNLPFHLSSPFIFFNAHLTLLQIGGADKPSQAAGWWNTRSNRVVESTGTTSDSISGTRREACSCMMCFPITTPHPITLFSPQLQAQEEGDPQEADDRLLQHEEIKPQCCRIQVCTRERSIITLRFVCPFHQIHYFLFLALEETS